MKLLPASILFVVATGCATQPIEKTKRVVRLEWDASPSDIDAYRVYYNNGTNMFDNMFVRASATNAELILAPGSYHAFVTAVKGVLESVPSNVVSFKVKGNLNDK